MSGIIMRERHRTARQDPRHGDSLQRERIEELSRLRREAWLHRDIAARQDLVIEWQRRLIEEQRELLRQAEPCPACVAKGTT